MEINLIKKKMDNTLLGQLTPERLKVVSNKINQQIGLIKAKPISVKQAQKTKDAYILYTKEVKTGTGGTAYQAWLLVISLLNLNEEDEGFHLKNLTYEKPTKRADGRWEFKQSNEFDEAPTEFSLSTQNSFLAI